jgi:hypothetical protein
LFLNNLEEKDVRDLFALFGPKPPRKEGKQREEHSLDLYLSSGDLWKGLPKKAPFAQKIADYNKTGPREKRLGSRSTSQANILRDLERTLVTHRETVETTLLQAKMLARDGFAMRVPVFEMPITTPNPKARPFRRKMSRQT